MVPRRHWRVCWRMRCRQCLATKHQLPAKLPVQYKIPDKIMVHDKALRTEILDAEVGMYIVAYPDKMSVVRPCLLAFSSMQGY